MVAALIPLVVGIAAGFVVAWAQLSDPAAIRDMLMLRDPHVFLVMGSAVMVAAILPADAQLRAQAIFDSVGTNLTTTKRNIDLARRNDLQVLVPFSDRDATEAFRGMLDRAMRQIFSSAEAKQLAIETAESFGRSRIALVGEAAHVIPPIGAQGLNLGLRDAATIAELVAEAHRAGADAGAPELLARK